MWVKQVQTETQSARLDERQKERQLNKEWRCGKANADPETQSTRLGEPKKMESRGNTKKVKNRRRSTTPVWLVRGQNARFAKPQKERAIETDGHAVDM